MKYPELSYEDLNRRLVASGLNPLAPSSAEIAHRILSISLGSASGYRGHVRSTSQFAAEMCLVAYEDERTLEVFGGLLPAVPATAADGRARHGWPSGRETILGLGLSPGDVGDLWKAASQQSERFALLPLGLVLAFFPPAIFSAVSALVEAGPGSSVERASQVLTATAIHPIPGQSRQKNRGLMRSKQTISNYTYAVERLLQTIHTQALNCYQPRSHARALAASMRTANEAGDASGATRHQSELASCHPSLNAWTTPLPAIRDAVELAEARKEDRSAPPGQDVRRAHARRNVEIAERRKRPYKYRTNALRVLRARLLLVLLVALSARITATFQIRVEDIDFEHRFSDGRIGPAIRLFPGKTADHRLASWKGITTEMAEMLREWLAYTGLEHHPQRSIWIAGWARRSPKESGHPSLFGVPGERMSFSAFASRNDSSRKDTLVPYADGRLGGYANHRFRHLGEQLARRAGHKWLAEHPEWQGRISDQVFADALTDHSFGAADRHGYNDLELHRDVFAREAIAGIWDLMFGETGARRAPDLAAIRDAENRRDRVRAEITAVEQQKAELRTQLATLTNGDLSLADPPAVTEDDDGPGLTRALLRLTGQFQEIFMHDRTERRQIAAVTAELDEAGELLDEIKNDLARAEARLADARKQTVPVDDLLSDEEYEALLAGAPTVVSDDTESGGDLEIIRDTLSAKQFAQALGVSEQSMRRWMAKRSCPYWSPDDYEDKVIEFSERRREVIIERLDHSKIAPGAMREIRRLQSEAA